MKPHVANGGPRIIPLSPNGMFGLPDLASMATKLTQNKPSEGFRRFGLAKMTARMDENKPFQASKWFRLASMATMLTQHNPSEAFSRFGFGHNDNMDGRAHTLSSLEMVSTGMHGHNVDSEQTF